jgi:hypothetical protein
LPFCCRRVTPILLLLLPTPSPHNTLRELIADFQASMARYVREGKVVVREHVTEGIERAGRAFIEV